MACQVDKGEFRWEFLVPWVNRSLTTVDKVVVCTSFVVASFTLQKLFDPGASVGAPPHPNPTPSQPNPTPPADCGVHCAECMCSALSVQSTIRLTVCTLRAAAL